MNRLVEKIPSGSKRAIAAFTVLCLVSGVPSVVVGILGAEIYHSNPDSSVDVKGDPLCWDLRRAAENTVYTLLFPGVATLLCLVPLFWVFNKENIQICVVGSHFFVVVVALWHSVFMAVRNSDLSAECRAAWNNQDPRFLDLGSQFVVVAWCCGVVTGFYCLGMVALWCRGCFSSGVDS